MRIILTLLLVSAFVFTNAQTTAIPDVFFEQALIVKGYDNVVDGVVLTNNIDTVTTLNLENFGIIDLAGIEGFSALTYLHCGSNFIINLDVSQNTLLTYLECNVNQLTSLDVFQNTALISLSCSVNQLTSLDISQNTALTYVNCGSNQLTCLNVNNGNNPNITYFTSSNNPNLTCIVVDDLAWTTANWTLWNNNIHFDQQTSFSTNCNNACSSVTVGMEENNFTNLLFYPNPTTGSINIDLGGVKQEIKATLTNGLGQVILTENYSSTNFIKLDIDAPKGIYFLHLESDGGVITKKIIKE